MTDVPVTQADREAAAEYVDALRPPGSRDIGGVHAAHVAAILDGERDREPLLQMLARHRVASTPAVSADMAGLVERLRDAQQVFDGDQDGFIAVEEAIVALSRLNAGWRGIESAPRDGTRLLGLFRARYASESRIETVWWQPEFEAFISGCREMVMAPGYTINGETRQLHSPEIVPVNFWLCTIPNLPPLPAPPVQDDAGEGM